MTIRVIVPPAPIVTPDEILGDHGANDRAVEAMIAAATAEIDGPQGWLGRCLGEQTLELSLDAWCGWNFRLPCPPLIAVESIVYLDVDGDEQSIDAANWKTHDNRLWFQRSFSRPSVGDFPGAIRIRYRAGYDGAEPAAGGTGDVPPQVKQAIRTRIQHMKAMGVENLFVRSEEVEGVGTTTYTVSDQAAALVDKSVERLLAGLRVFV